MYSIIRLVKQNSWIFKTKGFKNFLHIFTFLVFVVKGVVFLDPDFGWRYKAGEMYLSLGIPATDPFTYTMSSFPWVDHAWLQSAFFYLGKSFLGVIGLSVVYSVVTFCALAISFSVASKKVREKISSLTFTSLAVDLGVFGNFIFPLSLVIVFSFFGIRAQVFSWLMFAILLRLIFTPALWRKWRMFLPAFFLIWVNLHGSFSLGIFTLLATVVLRAFREKKISVDIIISLSCLLVTFINPYQFDVWREVFSSVLDSGLRWSIGEWMPSLTMASLSMAALFSVSVSLVIRQREIFSLEKLVVYFFLLLQAILSRRHLPLWLIFSLPMTLEAFGDFYNEVVKIKGAKLRLRKAYKVIWTLFLAVSLVEMFFATRGAYRFSEKKFYPKDALIYIRQNLSEKNVFSEYGWGGYLIWKLPKKKVFIDGRMPSWRWHPEDANELSSAFDTYNNILAGETNYTEVFDRYDIDTVLWSVPSEEEGPLADFYKSLEEFLSLFGREEKYFNFLEELESGGWKEVYKDDVAIIFEKPS